MEIIGGDIVRNELTVNAKGGTELMAERLVTLGKDILEPFQIIFGRVRELDESKLRILYVHDLPTDPEMDNALKNEGWRRFHKIIFVSNWQMQKFIEHYKIPFAKCLVLLNAIEPFEPHEKPTDIIRLAYWSTPHRGLNILLPVFDALCKQHDNIELEVYSSFELYGWKERDEPFKKLFEFANEHPKINNHGSVPNVELRKALEQCHILAFPSTWPETSCLVLMEAMSAGMVCVHPNFAALHETAANWTIMYQFNEDVNEHAKQLFFHLEHTIQSLSDASLQSRLSVQKTYADVFYNWLIREQQWKSFLTSEILQETRSLPGNTGGFFHVRT